MNTDTPEIINAEHKAEYARLAKRKRGISRAELHGLQEKMRLRFTALVKAPVIDRPPSAPRSQPLSRPEPERVTDDGMVTCPKCNEPRPHSKYPTDKHQVKDYRECRPCIVERRAKAKQQTK